MKNTKKHLSMALALCLVTTQLLSGATVASAAKKPALNKTKLTIAVGEKAKLKVKNKVKGSTYKWKSSAKKVAYSRYSHYLGASKDFFKIYKKGCHFL